VTNVTKWLLKVNGDSQISTVPQPKTPDRIRRIRTAVGLTTRRIERMESHPVWLLWLTCTTFNLDTDTKTATKQLRKVLIKGGIKIERDAFYIIDRRGDKFRCVFVLELAAPGVA
jgi:hypothetical protein